MGPAMRLALLAAFVATACAGPRAVPVAPPPPEEPPPEARAEVRLPPGWPSLGPTAFEDLLRRRLPGDRPAPLAAATAHEAERALEAGGAGAVRAVVVLARSGTPEAAERLLARLERRLPHPERAADAADVVAAAALPALPGGEDVAGRLEALAVGPSPHPDLEVRVECARSALALGRDGAIPFLVRVLRLGTPSGLADARSLGARETTAWARGRAAEALARRAGIPLAYEPDAPLAEREREAARLEGLLRRHYERAMR